MNKAKIINPFLILSSTCIGLVPITSCNKDKTEVKDITVTNNSDRIYITFESVPETWKTNTDFSCIFSLNENYQTIDKDNSQILVNETDIKNKEGIELTDTNLFIPGKYITDNLTISLQVKNITYKITNNSSEGIVFENLPTEIVQGWTINVNYSIPDNKAIDTDNSDIKVDGISIKNKTGVIYENNYLQIPADYTYGEIEISLILRDVRFCIIDYDGCSGITISGKTTFIKEKTEFKAIYTIDSLTDTIDRELSDITVNGTSIIHKNGVKYLNNEIYIPKEYTTGPISIKIVTEKAKLLDQSWTEVISACTQYETDKDETTFLSKFTIDGASVTSLDQLIGAKIAIKLGFYNSSSQTTTYKTQLVRIVGYNHDTISGSDNKAALTFQSVNLLSDLNGNQLRCVYDSSEKNTYSESTLCDNLTNPDYGYATWYDKDNNQVTEYKDSVYYMISQGDRTLYNAIKPIDKYVYEDSGTFEAPNWTETKIANTTIFPMLFKEMNLVKEETDPKVETEHASAYQYWINHNTAAEKIMKDENNNAWYYWLASPYTNNHSFAWNISNTGAKNHADVKTERFGVSFGFAI